MLQVLEYYTVEEFLHYLRVLDHIAKGGKQHLITECQARLNATYFHRLGAPNEESRCMEIADEIASGFSPGEHL